MAKFTIQRQTGSDIEVESDDYSLIDGYFWFRDGGADDVFTIKAADVYAIKRGK